MGWGGRNIVHVDCKQKRMRLWERCYMLRQVVTWKDVTCCVKLVVFTWTDVTCFAMGYGWSEERCQCYVKLVVLTWTDVTCYVIWDIGGARKILHVTSNCYMDHGKMLHVRRKFRSQTSDNMDT